MEIPTQPSFTNNTDGSGRPSVSVQRNLRRRKILGTLCAIITLVLGLTQATFAGVLAGWDTHSQPGGTGNFGTSPLAPAVSDPNLTVGGLTRGGGVLTPTGSSGAARAWGGTNWISTSEAGAVTAGQYVSCTITPNAGSQVSISGITQFNYRRSTTGAATGQLQYQIGSGSFVDVPGVGVLNYSNTNSSGAALAAIDLSGIAALQNVAPGTTVTFRIVNFGGTSTSGTWYVFDVANSTANDFEISGTVSAATNSTNPTAIASSDASSVAPGQNVQLTVQVTPGTTPASTGITVTGDLSQIGGSATQAFNPGPNNTFTYTATVPAGTAFGSKTLSFSVQDAQSRTASASLNLVVAGNLTIFHTNDTHARVTPHLWVIPQHSANAATQFEAVGGVAYLGGKMFSLVTGQPDALVLDGGDISEGNPVGDWNGPGNPTGSYGNGTAVEFYKLYDTKLRAIPGRGGRGLDAMVVGNHDIRDISYINNLKSQTNFPVISINICAKGTTTPYFQPYVIVNVNGHKIGIIGYTTESADSPEAEVNNLIEVKACDWSGTAGKIHFADYVNDLRNNQGCDMVILLTHDGHSDLCTSNTSGSTPILVDNSVAKLPEIAITGHWHTWAETVWQPSILNYKTIFTEADCFTHYIGELRVTPSGKYISNANYVLRNADITPDPDIAQLIQTRKDQFNATNPTYTTDQIIGYTADDLLLDNKMKWWSSDEYPWSGNNTAGNWICDAIQWKATALFGQCDLSIESGGGVRSDIPAGPVTYTQIYETYPWADDTIYVVNMTGAEISNYVQQHTCDVALSHDWQVTAFDGNPTLITYNGQPVSPTATYKVAISNYMYLHDSVPFSDPSPQTSSYLARTALVEFTGQYSQGNPYHAGPSRYVLNTEFSGGFRAVVMMMNDNDTKTIFEDAFIRLLSANSETLGHLGTKQLPTDLVNPDGSVNRANRLGEIEMYRSYLGFKTGALKPGDIIETFGKGSFFGGDPEWVDQEGIQADGAEFKIVGHDDSLAKPTYFSSINGFYNQTYKNHYVKFFARKNGTNTVVDKEGTTLTLQDVTGFAAYANVPGNNGDLLVITGIPTSESFSLRFRADSVTLASSQGITDFPPDSHINTLTADQTDPTLSLTATATLAPGANQTFYTLLSAADATVSSINATSTTNSTTLFVASAATGFGDERSWLRFDLSSIPAGSTITSAKLNLFCWATAGNTFVADACPANSDSWAETSINWNTQPTFGAALDSETLTAGSTNVLYTWDATSFVQSKFAGNQQVSLVVKAQTEGMATASTYRFDSKEFGSNIPYLQVAVSNSGTPATIAQVQFFYRFSTDNATWGAWTPYQTVSAAPYTASFTYPNGPGYYEFYSVATDSTSDVEPAPAFADAAVHFVPSVTTAPTNVSTNGATASGTYNPGGADTTVYFQYGTDTNYGSTTSSQDIGSGTNPVNFNASLNGLLPGTTYHVRAVIVVNGVTTYGADQTFTTAQAVPTMPAWGWLALGGTLVMLTARQLSKRRQDDLAKAA